MARLGRAGLPAWRLLPVVLALALALGLSGCRHRVRTAAPPSLPAAVPVETVTPPEKTVTVETPHVKMPPVPSAAAAAKVPKERKKKAAKVVAVLPAPVAAPVPAPVATAPPAPVSETAIGALTAGGPANPQTRQEAADLITSNERRLNALPSHRAEEQKAQISTVRNFERQAQEALSSGDAEGAKTLATKAKLLLDDLEK